jgi:hypothetical protein
LVCCSWHKLELFGNLDPVRRAGDPAHLLAPLPQHVLHIPETIVNKSGSSPAIASYNASVVIFYNAMGSLACFESKNIFFYFEKRFEKRYYNAGVIFVNFEVV